MMIGVGPNTGAVLASAVLLSSLLLLLFALRAKNVDNYYRSWLAVVATTGLGLAFAGLPAFGLFVNIVAGFASVSVVLPPPPKKSE